jgi:hypothetical protein
VVVVVVLISWSWSWSLVSGILKSLRRREPEKPGEPETVDEEAELEAGSEFDRRRRRN